MERVREQRFDAIFISHYHDDHCSFESLALLDRATPVYLYCLFDELFDMLRELGFETVHQLRLNTPVAIGEIVVIAREALDAEVDSMFHIQAGGMNVLNVVDSWIDPRALAILATFAPWDMVLWPFQTMREIEVLSPSRAAPAPPRLPSEWFDQLRVLAPRYVVPSSCQFVQEPWSWYNTAFFPVSYRQFQTEIAAALPATQVLRLNPSVSVTLAAAGVQPAPPLDWVIPVGPQDVDYAYDSATPAPSTADIARHFAPLTASQTALVRDWCMTGLLDKYRSMELPEECFFEQPRVWQLSLYDHAGQLTRFRYAIEGDTIVGVDDTGQALAWTTEVPIARLHGALALGETLSSMYLRVNASPFDAATERALATADVVDDPLIRCLFNGVFGAYQAAQLARLGLR